MTALTVTDLTAAPALAGRTFTGEWFSVETERLRSFEHASYFVDDDEPDFYPEGLVEGFHLLALLDHLGNALVRVDPHTIIAWNYGLNRVRFITPVHTGRRIRLLATISDVVPKNEGYLLTFDHTVELEDADRPAYSAQLLVLWLPVTTE
jgi:hypothetical protein